MSIPLQLAFAELGTKEIKGSSHNNRIINYALESGISGIETDETPWCSVFVNWVCHKTGKAKSGKPNARSWVNVGTKTNNPMPGDVVVFWRESPTSWKGHVGFFLGFSDDLSKVFCLGGNQGNAVSIAAYDARKVLQFQRISDEKTATIPKATLQLKNKGAEVENLQLCLNQMNYNCGDADGIFGAKTEQALKLFQANNQLEVNGVYTLACETMLTSLMQG